MATPDYCMACMGFCKFNMVHSSACEYMYRCLVSSILSYDFMNVHAGVNMALLLILPLPPIPQLNTIAKSTSWLQLWDLALDRGVHGTHRLQTLLKALSYRMFDNFIHLSFRATLRTTQCCYTLICQMHFEAVSHMSYQEILFCLVLAEANSIFSCKLQFFYFVLFLLMPYGCAIN